MAGHHSEMDNWEEYKAMYILEDVLSEYKPFEKSVSPDLLSAKCGFEVVSARGNAYEQYFSEYAKELEKERAKNEQDQDMEKLVRYNTFLVDKNATQRMLNLCYDAFSKKVEKLQKYQQREFMGIFIYTCMFHIGEDFLRSLLENFTSLQKDKKYKFRYVALYAEPVGKVYVIDLFNSAYKCVYIHSSNYDNRLDSLQR